ncbi:MAP kinase kinase kinase wis4 [Vanrija pseudolonga]|uniref:MAP kinase kinase kinase wis4 n=1 Tax=Vanrija pseudolonga TaxID=143232 RepID=A0AAF1BMR2_9TREE|nr:MAP kinase kinase kinase wis4 [Vanrija pseudolonga]
MADRSSPLANQLPIAGEPSSSASSSTSKPRRKVRMFAAPSPESSTHDELPKEPPTGDDQPSSSGHMRSSSYSGQPTNPPSRIPSLTSSAPKLNRSATYTRGAASANAAPPPTPGLSEYEQWKIKYAGGGSGQHQRTSSLRRKPALRDPYARLDNDDAGYSRGVDDWHSDYDDDDDLDRPTPVKALVADAVRYATGKGDGQLPTPSGVVGVGVGQPKSLILTSPPPDAAGPETAEGKERLEWQSMLASVLGGDILRGESSRIGVERPSSESFRKALSQSLWWQIRARLRNRSEEEEKRIVQARRNKIVDTVLEEIDKFTFDETSNVSPIDQVAYILEKLAIVESLYPHQAALRQDKPLYDSESFQARIDALSAWYSVVVQLKAQLLILQKWTGTDDLDITRPNTTKEKALVGKSRYHPLDSKGLAQAQNDLAADDSTFVDRILKEDSLRRTFEKRVFVHQIALIQNAKQTVISYSPVFADLKIPTFQYELERIISFPGRLIIEALKTRLSAAERLSDPDLIIIDDMAESLRTSVALAIFIRRQYEEIVAPDPERRWVIPECFPPAYNQVLLNSIEMFFKLLHWKLKNKSKSINLRQTDILEVEWPFLYDAAEAIEGADLIVAESLCVLTNKLIIRVINYFETSLRVPVRIDATNGTNPKAVTTPDHKGRDRAPEPMTTEEMVVFFTKLLDSIRMRYRKLQRFARRLQQRFHNSAEYIFEDDDTELLIHQLHESGHFLVYTSLYEEQGTYIFADGSLWDRPEDVKQLLFRVFANHLPGTYMRRINDTLGEQRGSEYDDEEDEDDAQYLLLISPRQNFAWTGAVMTLDVGKGVNLGLEDSRIRLVADGPTGRLAYCKAFFMRSFIDPETEVATLQPLCIVEQQAHLPKVNHELKRISRSAHRLSEYIIESATLVRRTLRGDPGTQDLIENWYLFASDHGHRAAVYMDHLAWARFSRLLMRLAIGWVSFICDDCDPTDRKTFRWTVNALEYAMLMTRGNNILHLNTNEFALLRAKVASCMSLLISHFDILGARSSLEAKKESERLEGLRRMQRIFERPDEDDFFLPRAPTPDSASKMQSRAERSLRLVRDERLALISDLEQQRLGLSTDQHLMGRVLDEEVSEDRALVFLAASASNISLRWQQGGFIGGGANGSVYLGFNLDSGGIMAVKEIRVQDITNSPALYKQIKDEADVMQMLSHPNIVDYYGIEVHRDRVYIFEEYCPGGSLANLLEHGRVEDEDVIMVYAWQMLQGLQYLHSQGVEHRDVKPDNILLGANSVLKFVDFGAAKVIIKGNRTMAKTRAISKSKSGAGTDAGPAVMNSLAGTPMYIAPEVIKGGAGRLGSADMWSMGCVVLEVTTGRKPWSNLDNEWAIMFHIGIATQHPPLPEPGQLSELGIDFIEQCLTLDPEKRPTATELLNHPWLAPMREYTVPDQSPAGSSLPSAFTEAGEHYPSPLGQHEVVVEDYASYASTPPTSTPPLSSTMSASTAITTPAQSPLVPVGCPKPSSLSAFGPSTLASEDPGLPD